MPHFDDAPPLDPRRQSTTSNATTESFESAQTHLSNDASSGDMAVSAPATGNESVFTSDVEDQVTGDGFTHTDSVSPTDGLGDTPPYLNGSLTDRSHPTSPISTTDENDKEDNNKQVISSADDTTPRGRTPCRNTHSESPAQPGINDTHPDIPRGQRFRRNSDIQTTTHPNASSFQLHIRVVRNEFNTPLPDTPEMEAGTGQGSEDLSGGGASVSERRVDERDSNVPSQLSNSDSTEVEARTSTLGPEDHHNYIVRPLLNDSNSGAEAGPWDAEPFRQFSENTFSTTTRPPSEQPYYGRRPLFAPPSNITSSAGADLPDEDKENKCLRCPIHCFDPETTAGSQSPSQPRGNDDEMNQCLQCPNHCPDPDEMTPSPSPQLPRNFDGADDSKPHTPPTGSSGRRPAPRRNLGTGSSSQPNLTEQPDSQPATSEQQSAALNVGPIQRIPPFNHLGRTQTASSALQNFLSGQDHVALENERRTAAYRRSSGSLYPGLERGRTIIPYDFPPSGSSDEHGSPSVHYDFSLRGRGRGRGRGVRARPGESGVGVGTDRLRPDDRPAAQLNPAARTFDPRTQLRGSQTTQTVEYWGQGNMGSGNGRGRGLGQTLRITERELQQNFIQFDEAARRDDPFSGPLIRESSAYQTVGPQQMGQQQRGYQPFGYQPYGQQPSGYQPSGNQLYGYQPYASHNPGSQSFGYQPSGPAPTRPQPGTQQPPNPGGQTSTTGFGNTTQTTEPRYKFAMQPNRCLVPIPNTPEQRYSAPQHPTQQAPLYHPPPANLHPLPQPLAHQPTYHHPTAYRPNPLGPTTPNYGGNTQRLPPPAPQGSLTSPIWGYNPRPYPWQVASAGQGRGRGVAVGVETGQANVNATSALKHPAPRIVSTGLSGEDSEESVESEE